MAPYVFCPVRYDPSHANPAFHYNQNQDGIDNFEWGHGSGTEYDKYPSGGYNNHAGGLWDANYPRFLNPRDGDYPGVDTSAIWTGESPNRDISGGRVSIHNDVWDHWNECWYGTANQALQLTAEDSSDPSRTMNTGLASEAENAGRIRFDAPEGMPTATGNFLGCYIHQYGCQPQSVSGFYDSGWYAGAYETFWQTGPLGNGQIWSQWNHSPELIGQLAGPGVIGYQAIVQYGTRNCARARGAHNAWADVKWDFANYYNNDRVSINDCTTQNLTPDQGSWAPFSAFTLRFQCYGVGIPGGSCPVHANDNNNQDTVIQARDIVLYNWDREAPSINLPNGLPNTIINSEEWQKGNKAALLQAGDMGNGVSSLYAYANNELLWLSGSGRQACHQWGVDNNTTTTDRTGWGGWHAFSESTNWYSGGGRINFSSGACPNLVLFGFQSNVNSNPWKQGHNTLRIQVSDYAVAANEDQWGSYIQVRDPYNPNLDYHGSANVSNFTRDVYVDSLGPVSNAPTVSAPTSGLPPYENDWVRGEVKISGSARDNTSQTSTVSGISLVRTEVKVANGDWELLSYKTGPNTTESAFKLVAATSGTGDSDGQPPSSGTGTQSTDPNNGRLYTAGNTYNDALANGTQVHFRTVAYDHSGNETISSVVTRTVDNAKPTADVQKPQDPQDGPYVITVIGEDAHSGVHHVECEVIDNAPGGGTTTIATFADGTRETSCSYEFAKDSEILSYRVYDNAGNVSEQGQVEPDIDVSGPTLQVTGAVNDWTNQNVTLTAKATDHRSGVDRIYVSNIDYPSISGSEPSSLPDLSSNASWSCTNNCNNFEQQVPLNQEAHRLITFYAEDEAGNLSNPVMVRVRIDKTAPVPANGNAWYAPSSNKVKGNTTIGLNAVDPPVTLPNGSTQPMSGLAANIFQICFIGNGCGNEDNWTTIDASVYPQIPAPRCQQKNSAGVDGSYECNYNTAYYGSGQFDLRSLVDDVAGNRAVVPGPSIEHESASFCQI